MPDDESKGREYVPILSRRQHSREDSLEYLKTRRDDKVAESGAEVVTKARAEVTPTKSTGIALLDKNLGGGLPAGSVVYFSTEAGSMAEVYLYQFAAARKTYYFTTSRRAKYVNQNIIDMGFDTSDVNYVDIYGQYYLDDYGAMVERLDNEYVDREIVDFTEHQLMNIQREETGDFNIVFDTFSFYLGLNVNLGKVLRLINMLYEMTKETGILSFLYFIKDTHDQSIEREVMNLCDAVFDIVTERSGEKIVNKLYIPKIRGKGVGTSLIKFKIDDGVQIDTSRDIA